MLIIASFATNCKNHFCKKGLPPLILGNQDNSLAASTKINTKFWSFYQ